MAVIGTPVQTPSEGTVICSDLSLVEPGAVTHEGCPLLTRQRVVVSDKGVKATVRWEMRDREGGVVDLSSCLACETVPSEASESLSVSETTEGECGSVLVRFGSCDEQGDVYEVTGAADTPAAGLVSFQLPQQVYDFAGIWRVQVAVTDGAGDPVFMNTGLVSIERGLFGDLTKMTGPPTLNEIRLHIRDTALENDLLQEVEFDDDEIVAAMLRPVQYWNETPPMLRRYQFNCTTFPWRMHWLNGIVAQLLRTAAHFYMRNKLKVSHGGVSGDDRDRNKEYMQMSTFYWGEYTEFAHRKKVELNAGQCFGSITSGYSG